MTTSFTVQFVHFPKSSVIRDRVQERIEECIEKLHAPVSFVRVLFGREGLVHHVKLLVNAGYLKACVEARADDFTHAIEKALHKLVAAFVHARGRRTKTRRKAMMQTRSLDLSALAEAPS